MQQVAQLPNPQSIEDLQVSREKDKRTVNEFLRQTHPLGGVQGWKAVFSARHRNRIVAVVVLGRPVARNDDNGSNISITRYSRIKQRPDNTGSWLISKARTWADLEGYSEIKALSGVAGNYGTVYTAAGFLIECYKCDWRGHPKDLQEDGFCPNCGKKPYTKAYGKSWMNRENRQERSDYTKRKWVCELNQVDVREKNGDTE